MGHHPNSVKYEADRVVFYLRGAWTAIVVVLALAFWLSVTWWLWAGTGGLGIGGGVLGLAVCLLFLSVMRVAVAALRRSSPVLVVYDTSPSEQSGGAGSWPACKVTRIIVRERMDVRYAPLIQLLLEMRDEVRPVVALQRNMLFRGQVTEVAERLGARWDIDVFIVPREASPLACSVIGAILACVIMFASFWLGWKEHVVSSWPCTSGVLVSLDLGVHGQGPGGGFEYADPRAEYEYMVGGIQYRSTGVKPSPFHYWSRKSLERDFAGMKPGAPVTVRFHPRIPEKSYIVAPGVSAGTIALGVVGAGLMLLAALDFGLRRREKG